MYWQSSRVGENIIEFFPERGVILLACAVRERLPVVPIPLTEEAGEVPLEVGAALNRCYEEGAFSRTIHYHKDPVPPLAFDDSEWANALLKENGLLA